MASDTQQICSRHSESTVRFDAEEHDACETMAVLNQPGGWMSENGNVTVLENALSSTQ